MYSRSVIISKLVYGYEELAKASVSIGDVLITVDADAAFKSDVFAKRLRNLQTHVLSNLFEAGVKVVTRSEKGRLHCHAAVRLNFEIHGFDWSSFDQAKRWYELYRSTRQKSCLRWYRFYKRAYETSMPEQLKSINQELKQRARIYGFGHVFILPIRKNSEALKWYLVKNVPHTRQKRDSKIHYFTSWGLETTGKFKHMTPRYNDYRDRLKQFCLSLKLVHDNYQPVLKELLGPQWHWQCRKYIKYIVPSLNGEFLPVSLQASYEELRRTVRQHLIRTGQYVVDLL